MKSLRWRKYALEFLSIFIAVISAFTLNNWNENRRDHRAETKILTEILQGLDKDILDVRENMAGHQTGLAADKYFRRLILNQETELDSFHFYYYLLFRDFISIQNTSGYEALKSRGLELVSNDTLRNRIISLYEYDYSILRKMEEEYHELQFQENYFQEVNLLISPNFQFDNSGTMVDLELPFNLPEKDQKLIFSYLWKMRNNRNFILRYYDVVEEEIIQLRTAIEAELVLH